MKRKTKIIHNRVQCKTCGDVIESKSRHDFVCCTCFKESKGVTGIAVDGGLDYLRRCGDPLGYEELSETRLYTDEERDEYNKRIGELYQGISLHAPDYME